MYLLIAAIVGTFLFTFICIYAWRIDHSVTSTPASLRKLVQKPWTVEEMKQCYRKVQESPTDVTPFLFSRTGRRYVVSGGSGLVGGWIVEHLLMRGEDPSAIRILDTKPPSRPGIVKSGVQFIETDVSDMAQVSKVFNAPWNSNIEKQPLTVFHTVAYIHSNDRTADFMPIYNKVNVEGTEHVLKAARAAGSSCFIATSSGAVGMKPVQFFFQPWKNEPDHIIQPLMNGDPANPNGKLEDFASCYAYSKNLAEKIVCQADSEKDGFRTGLIRPGHAIYGHGINSPSSFTYDFLKRGGSFTWLSKVITNIVNAQNVSIGHLAYERKLISDQYSGVGGQAFSVTDPSPPITYGHIYSVLATLAHPSNPVKFPNIPFIFLLVLAHVVEAYMLLRHRYLKFLPPITGDLWMLQPAMLQVCTVHLFYDDSRAKTELGYNAPIMTLEGLCQQVLYFNKQFEAKS